MGKYCFIIITPESLYLYSYLAHMPLTMKEKLVIHVLVEIPARAIPFQVKAKLYLVAILAQTKRICGS
jgi:hypothetical protein